MALPLGIWSFNTSLGFNPDLSDSLSSNIDFDSSIQVQCIKLDNILFGFKPNFIKFDIEGAELEALIGAKNSISLFKPDMAISIYHRPNHPYDILKTLLDWDLGYSFYIRCHEYNSFGLVLYCIRH